MALMQTAAEIWRKYVLAGVPGSGANTPDKGQIVAWGTQLETLLNGAGGGLGYQTIALLLADLAHDANTLAIVYADTTTANNGLYVKSGATGYGTWSRIGDLPNGVVRLTVTGGTGNAIVATAPETPSVPGAKLYILTPTANNTAATAIVVNGAASVAIKNAFGSTLASGSLVNGSPVLMAWVVDHYQIMVSAVVDGTAILSDAVAARDAAAASASALGNQARQYDTRTLAAAATVPAGVNVLTTFGLATVGDGGGFTYIRGTIGGPGAFQSADGQYWNIAPSPGAGVVDVSYPGGRLTLTTGVAVMTTGVAGATTVYYTPASGKQIPLYDGTRMISTTFAELSQTTTDTTKSPAAVSAGLCYDLFVWNDAGTVRLSRGPAWASDTARSLALTLVQGVYLNNASITNGPAAQRGTYVGTIRSNASSTIDLNFGSSASGGGLAWFGIWNNFNRVPGAFCVIDSSLAWTVGITQRALNGSNGNRVSILHGLDEDAVSVQLVMRGVGVASQQLKFGLGLDNTTTFISRSANSYSNGVSDANHIALFNGMIGLGFHFIQAQELSTGGAAQGRMSDIGGGFTGINWW